MGIVASTAPGAGEADFIVFRNQPRETRIRSTMCRSGATRPASLCVAEELTGLTSLPKTSGLPSRPRRRQCQSKQAGRHHHARDKVQRGGRFIKVAPEPGMGD